MDAKLKKLVVILTIIDIFLTSALISMKTVFSYTSGGKIDLFTQNEPYSGKGFNVPSDAFSFGELVEIYALVTYHDSPVEGLLVAFEIVGPKNPIENITFYRTAFTNEIGIAMISFRISHINEIAFGEWTVIGNTKIGDLKFVDSVSFKVDWVVKIVSIKTTDENYMYQEKFTRGSYMGIELGLRNIAMTTKKITLAATIYDHLDVFLNSTEINDLELQPNGVLIYAHCFLYIPTSAYVGEATACASAYMTSVSLGGVPCCPEVSKRFLITNRDVAVLSVHPSPTKVYIGETINIDVVVKNKGWEIESFNVSAYYNETSIGVSLISDLQPRSNETLRFIWNTSVVLEGIYRISVHAEPVPGEINTADNVLINGFVEVTAPVHDIAVLSVTPSSNVVHIGETLDIDVIIKNEGNYIESFDVVLYYSDSNVIGKLSVDSLMPNHTKKLVFHWDLSDISEGNYTLSALAEPVIGEEDIEDNHLEDGVVEIRAAPKGWFVPDWFYWFLLPLLILLIIVLILWLYRRRRKKAEEAFYSGWTAWYYCYDLKNRTSKNQKTEFNKVCYGL